MIKHKAKAERAAARQAKAAAEALTRNEVSVPPPSEVPSDPSQPQDSPAGGLDGILPGSITRGASPAGSDAPSPAEPTPKPVVVPPPNPRMELFRDKRELLMRFMRLMTPVLVEVYAASVALNIRTRALTGLLKAASWLDEAELWKVVEHIPLASFIGSILSSRDQQPLLTGALQLVELLLIKLPVQYRSAFRREGVLHEVMSIADQDLTTKVKLEPTSASNTPAPEESESSAPPPAPSAAILRRHGHLSSHYAVDSQDANILRARIVRFRYLSPSSSSTNPEDGNETDANDELEALKAAAKRLAAVDLDLKGAKEALKSIANLFNDGGRGKGKDGISSYEMLQSGLVDELLGFAKDENRPSELIYDDSSPLGRGTDLTSLH